MRELVAANDDCDQTGYLCDRASEEGLHCRESGIERRLRQGKRREKDQQGEEGKARANPAQAAPEGSLQPACGRKCGDHRHLQRSRSGRDMP
jgi:hypothetical protein